MHTFKPRFPEMLREARETADQTVEVMAILLNMKEEDYLAIERGEKYPDNDTLKRLCMMLEWNYYDTERMIINEMTMPHQSGTLSTQGEEAVEALQNAPLEPLPSGKRPRSDSLGQRLKEVREHTGQAVDIIAMLLNIAPEAYLELENGAPPGDDLLRRISIIYDWNYHDLLSLLRSEQAKSLQPRRMGNPFPGRSSHQNNLKSLLSEVESLFIRLAEPDQRVVVSQLELIRETMRRMQQAS